MKFVLLAAFAWFYLAAVALAAADAGRPEDAGFTKHFENSFFRITEKGLFGVEVVVGRKELTVIGKNAVGIVIHDCRGEDVDGADIEVSRWSHEKGESENLASFEKGGGLYILEKMDFKQGDNWELRIRIRLAKKNVEDNVVFVFPDAAREKLPAGKYDATLKKIEGRSVKEETTFLDASTSKMSKNKLFRVSYVSESGDVPLIKVHSWELKIVSADNRPVNGAEISIDGRMSRHQHGLPTKPAVSESSEKGGRYLVKGIKFNMPGWWEITFDIKANDLTDSVTFNLYIE